MSDNLAYATISTLAPRIAAREISPIELTEAALARIETLDQSLNSFITVTAEQALDTAGKAEQAIAAGDYRGPLHGIPVAAKDLFATKGVRTTAGSKLYTDWRPDHDATAVARLADAGAVLLGKTNMHELAYGTKSNNPHYGPVRNPWDRVCHPGGSSGGSAAAVAAGLAMGALGSDTGASIRQPAACCGIVGLKPTYGRVSKFGAVPLAWSMDHAGPMTRSVKDAALMLQVLAGPDPLDPTTVDHPVPDYTAIIDQGIGGSRIGVARSYFFDDCGPGVAHAMEAAIDTLRGLGATIEDVEIAGMAESRAASTLIISVEAAARFGREVRDQPEGFSDELLEAITMGAFFTAEHYLLAQRARRRLSDGTRCLFAGYDGVIMPTQAVTAGPIDDDPPKHGLLRWRNTEHFDLTGLPAISVPCGFAGDGLPVGLQIAGNAFDEAGVLRIAQAYEQATEWHRKHPAVD
jgi:aspartyl-tRNA(Asn)/glutamyl-tRNA(Gln) amidotransferase subunit A